jgi:hypothetical protein
MVAVCGLAMVTASAHAQPLSLRIPDETVAPGGVLQAKLELTEPRPIFTGGGGMSFGGYDEFLGLAVRSPNGDAAAVGVMRGSTLRLRMLSPTSDLGSAGEYPLLATTLRVPLTAPVGQRSALDLTGGQFLGPGGAPYTYALKPGVATVGQVAGVIDVTPGSALVPAGGTIVINGLGFEPGTKVKLKEAAVSNVSVIGTTQILVTPAVAVLMHGQEIEIEIPSTGQKFSYFSYQRTATLGRSAHALIGAVEPAFPRQFWTSSLVRFTPPTSNDVYGVALQNEGTAPSAVSLSLVQDGGVRGPVQFVLPANARASRSLAEVFGTSCQGGCALRMTASVPIQIFGLAGDLAADAVLPVLPTADVVTVLTVSVATNAASYRAGDLLVVTTTITPGVVPANADAYVVLTTPTGDYWSLTPGGLVPGVRPYFVNRTVAGASTTDVLRAPLPAGVPTGIYQWLTALAVPGTAQLLTPVRSQTFAVTP